MTVVSVAWTYLKGRTVASGLTIFSVALGVSLIIDPRHQNQLYRGYHRL